MNELHEIKQLKQEMLELLQQDKRLHRFEKQIEMLLSRFESEMRTSADHGNRIATLDFIVQGDVRQGKDGIADQVRIMWRVHTWMMCLISGLAGVIGTLLVQRFFT